MTMTNHTPESVIAEALRHMVPSGDATMKRESQAYNIAAALHAANMLREPGEPEWEYVGRAFEHGGFMRIRNDQLTPEKFDSWRKLMAQYPRVEILKRVKAVPAGPWLPVEGESE